jgi:hypothetical protein
LCSRLAQEAADNVRRLKSMSIQEKTDEEIEGIEDIEADINLSITKGFMVKCDPALEQFLRHHKKKLTSN